MKLDEIQNRFEKCIDQYYATLKYTSPEYKKESELYYIGGILKAALHVLPNDRYFDLEKYVYKKHGYDPGGVRGQIKMDMLKMME